MSRLHPIVAGIVALACGAAAAQTQLPSPSTQVAGTPDRGARVGIAEAEREFVENAAHAGHAEVRASRLALSKATNPDVKNFAQRMIDDHTQANQKLRQIAIANRIDVPSDPAFVQRAKLQLLEAADGQDFDQRYADEFGVEAHRETIGIFEKAIAQVRHPQLNAFARETLPKLQEHLQMAQTLQASVQPTAAVNRGTGSTATGPLAQVDQEDLRDAQQDVNEAVQVVQRMKSDPNMAGLLQRAKGVFIMPNYGRGALGIGAQGGEGVLVVRQGDQFSNPVFYNMGGLSIGAQVGGAGGQLAMLLMTDRAVENFKSGKKFSINADAGLTIVDYSKRAQTSTGKVQDVIVWSNTKGAYAGVSVGVTDVVLDKDANRAYYRREGLNPQQIIEGAVPNLQNKVLDRVLRA